MQIFNRTSNEIRLDQCLRINYNRDLRFVIDMLSERFSGTKQHVVKKNPVNLTMDDLITALKSSLPNLNDSKLFKQGIAQTAVFDFDGTLIDASIGDYMRKAFLEEFPVSLDLRERINTLLKLVNLKASSDRERNSGELMNYDINRLLERHKIWTKSKFSDSAEYIKATWEIYEVYSLIYAGYSLDTLREFAKKNIVPHIKSKYFSGVDELFRELACHQIETGIISASPEFLVQEAAKGLLIKSENTTGSRLKVSIDGVLKPELSEMLTFREGKIVRTDEIIKRQYGLDSKQKLRPLLAFGDAPAVTDKHLLENAEIAVVIKPRTNFDLKAANKMAYDGKYVLIVYPEKTVTGSRVSLAGHG